MPLNPPRNIDNEVVLVDVCDFVQDGVTFKQKARVMDMRVPQHDNGDLEVHLDLRMQLYGTTGERVDNGRRFRELRIPLMANNRAAVLADLTKLTDPAARNGVVVYRRGLYESNEEWNAKLAADTRPLELQGNWFRFLMHSIPVKIGPMQREFILRANESPSAFAN